MNHCERLYDSVVESLSAGRVHGDGASDKRRPQRREARGAAAASATSAAAVTVGWHARPDAPLGALARRRRFRACSLCDAPSGKHHTLPRAPQLPNPTSQLLP